MTTTTTDPGLSVADQAARMANRARVAALRAELANAGKEPARKFTRAWHEALRWGKTPREMHVDGTPAMRALHDRRIGGRNALTDAHARAAGYLHLEDMTPGCAREVEVAPGAYLKVMTAARVYLFELRQVEARKAVLRAQIDHLTAILPGVAA